MIFFGGCSFSWPHAESYDTFDVDILLVLVRFSRHHSLWVELKSDWGKK